MGIFASSRSRTKPLRKLWLENCSIAGFTDNQLNHLNLHGLESIRMRRLQLLPNTGIVSKQLVYARGKNSSSLHDGSGGRYLTSTAKWADQEAAFAALYDSFVQRKT